MLTLLVLCGLVLLHISAWTCLVVCSMTFCLQTLAVAGEGGICCAWQVMHAF
jgi:hypothetical protein